MKKFKLIDKTKENKCKEIFNNYYHILAIHRYAMYEYYQKRQILNL